MGKRDFVDRVDSVEPVGESVSLRLCSTFYACVCVSKISLSVFSSPLDGVVIVDPEALQGRKGESDNVLVFLGKQENLHSETDALVFCPVVFVTLSCTFRYGRDDMDVMGIAFRRELYLSTRQVYPPLQDRDRSIHTRIQAKLLRKLGDNAFPFFFEVKRVPLTGCASLTS